MGTDKQEDMQTAIPSMQMSSLNLTYQEEISQPGCKKKKKNHTGNIDKSL